MGQSAVGEVVLVNFPFSDLRHSKRRPALVLAEAEYGDVILCLITSRPFSSERIITLDVQTFQRGGLPVTSYIRYDKLATLHRSLIGPSLGSIKPEVMSSIFSKVRSLFKA